MKANVFEKIASEKPSLLKQITRNKYVADAVMGYLNVLVGLSAKQGFPIEGVRLSKLVWCQGDVFRALVSYSKIGVASPLFLGAKSDFFRYAASKASFMARALERNATLEPFFADMVDQLDGWARQKGCRFQDIEIVAPIVTKDKSVLQFGVKRVLALVF